MTVGVTFRGDWHLERFSWERDIKALPIAFTHAAAKQRYTHRERGRGHASIRPGSLKLRSVCLMSHLGLVALLGAQTRPWSVKLLGYDAQKLRLVLRSVAVRRTNVHHLEKSGGTDTERCTRERGTEAAWVLGRCGDYSRQEEKKKKSKREKVIGSLFRPDNDILPGAKITCWSNLA